MQVMMLDCVKDATWNNTAKTFTFPYPIYPGLKLCDVCIGRVPVSNGIRTGSVAVVSSTVSPYNISVDAGSSVGTFTVTAANPNVATLNT